MNALTASHLTAEHVGQPIRFEWEGSAFDTTLLGLRPVYVDPDLTVDTDREVMVLIDEDHAFGPQWLELAPDAPVTVEPTPVVSVSGAAREATEAQARVPSSDQYAAAREAMGNRGWHMPELAHEVADAVVAAGPVDAETAVVAERDALRAAIGVVGGDASDDAVLLAFSREKARADRAEDTLAECMELADKWARHDSTGTVPRVRDHEDSWTAEEREACDDPKCTTPCTSCAWGPLVPEPQADSKPGQNLEVDFDTPVYDVSPGAFIQSVTAEAPTEATQTGGEVR